jgi:hypothetical protein
MDKQIGIATPIDTGTSNVNQDKIVMWRGNHGIGKLSVLGAGTGKLGFCEHDA